MRRVLRVFALTFVGVLLVGMVFALVFHGWMEAQGRGFIVLTRTSNTPVLGWLVGVLTDEPRSEDTTIADEPALLVRPGEGRSWPAVVFLNGVTRRGRFHPTVRRLARALARAGYLVVVPDLPGLRDGTLSARTLAGAKAVVGAVESRPDVRGGRVALFGVSVGGSLALLAAEDPALRHRVRVVAALAPYTSLADVVRIATTSTYVAGGSVHAYRSKPFAALVAARSLVAALPPGSDRVLLVRRLDAVPDNANDPLATLRALEHARLRRSTRAVVRLLTNTQPRRFAALYAALSPQLKRAVASLSPIRRSASLRAPVLIASAPHDKYFPPEQSRALARSAPHVSLTVTPTLQHAIPQFSFHDLVGIARFDEFLVRAMHAAG